MITLTIDNQHVQLPEGGTILDAARKAGIEIPTLCHADGFKPTTSCMVCVVQVQGAKHLVPACGTRAADNMVIVTDSEPVLKSRKAAIELLLSDHVGDCIGPCVVGCPANMDIPLMLRQIAADEPEAAIRTVKEDIPLPAILGRICPGPCEKVCRRAQHDQAVSICLLKRFVADVDLASAAPYRPECAPSVGKKVAIIGAGPAGLSAAYYLRRFGIDATIYDDHSQPGGALRYEEACRNVLPLEVIETEIEQILKLGVEFHGHTRVGRNMPMAHLKERYDAVLVAVGNREQNDFNDPAVAVVNNKIQVRRPDYSTSEKGVFAAGGCTGSRNLCIRAVADGKEAAVSIRSYLFGLNEPQPQSYNHRMGRVENDQMQIFLKLTSDQERISPQNPNVGFDVSQAKSEALRCLHCDCRKANTCGLRQLATAFGARQKTWQGAQKLFSQISDHPAVLYEPGKCIQCGLCVQVAKKHGLPKGLAFQGRGFNMEIVVPLNGTLSEGMGELINECVQVCPTGALAFRQEQNINQ